MSLFFVFLPIQILAFVITGCALERALRRSVGPIIEKNSYRMDGSFSERRNAIELQSVGRCCRKIHEALVWLFVFSFLIGLMTAGFVTRGFSWNPDIPQNSLLSPEAIEAFVGFVNEWQWQLLFVYAGVILFLSPPYLVYVYRKSHERYFAKANRRFLDYYRSEAVRLSEPN